MREKSGSYLCRRLDRGWPFHAKHSIEDPRQVLDAVELGAPPLGPTPSAVTAYTKG